MFDPMHKYSLSAMRQYDHPFRIERLERLARAVENGIGTILFQQVINLRFYDAKGDLSVTIDTNGGVVDDFDDILYERIKNLVADAWVAEGEDSTEIDFEVV